MPLFESSVVQVTASVTGTATAVWNPTNTSTTTYGALGSVTAGNVLKDVTVVNTGANIFYVGSGSIAVNSATGLAVPPGGQITIQGYNITSGTTAGGTIWAQTAGGGTLSSAIAGLASVASVV